MNMEPTPGMTVKLKHGVLALSARVVQHVTAVKKLKVNEGESFDEREPYLSQADVDGEGGYWIQTDRTKGEWWAWSLFRTAGGSGRGSAKETSTHIREAGR